MHIFISLAANYKSYQLNSKFYYLIYYFYILFLSRYKFFIFDKRREFKIWYSSPDIGLIPMLGQKTSIDKRDYHYCNELGKLYMVLEYHIVYRYIIIHIERLDIAWLQTDWCNIIAYTGSVQNLMTSHIWNFVVSNVR